MKYLLITILLISCVTDENTKEDDIGPAKGTIPITYETNRIDLNVVYCRPDGNIDVAYGRRYGFDTTMYFNPGSKVCLYAEKRDKNLYQSVVITIKRDSSTRIFFDKEDDEAAVSGYLE